MREAPARPQACRALEANAAAVQTAKTLAAWLNQLLSEIQVGQMARFRQLRPRLQSDPFGWDNAVLTHSVQVWLGAARDLDFESLRSCGFWARLTGAAEGAARQFGRNYETVLSAAAKVKHEFELLSRDYRGGTSGTRRLMVELDFESQALDREMDQGAEWLVELSQAIETAGELHALSHRAMTLSGEIRRLREVTTLAKEIAILGQNVLERRATLFEMLKFDLDGFDRAWFHTLSHIGKKAVDGQFPSPVLEKAREVHGELVRRLELTNAACLDLQMEEQSMARRLAMLCNCLETPTLPLEAPALPACTS